MWPIFLFEVKYYFKNIKEVIQLVSLFFSIVLLYPFALSWLNPAHQYDAPAILWLALIVATGFGSSSLFQRDLESGRVAYYHLAVGSLERVILAKWLAYYIYITIPLGLMLPFTFLLVDIPVDAWSHYAIGLASGSMALSILSALIALLMAGLEKGGAVAGLIMLPLCVPLLIFGTGYLAEPSEHPLNLLFLGGFSLFLLPILCIAGASCLRTTH